MNLHPALCFLFFMVFVAIASSEAQTTTEPTKMSKPEIKRLSENKAWVTTSERNNKAELGLDVYIDQGDTEAPIKVTDVKIRALDQKGKEISSKPMYPKMELFGTVGRVNHTSYLIELKSDQSLKTVNITYKGDTQQFPISSISKGSAELPATFRTPVGTKR